MLEINNLYKKYGEHEVLKNININLNKGEKLVIIGASGSGKSTLLRCMNFLEEASKGKIFFEVYISFWRGNVSDTGVDFFDKR